MSRGGWESGVWAVIFFFFFSRHVAERMAILVSPTLCHISTIRWFAMAFGTDIHGPQRMNSTEFGEPKLFFERHNEVDIFGL